MGLGLGIVVRSGATLLVRVRLRRVSSLGSVWGSSDSQTFE